MPFTASVYRHPSEFPAAVWKCFDEQPQNSNIIYAHAKKVVSGGGLTANASDLWIICWSVDAESSVLFIASCTTGPLGPYPVFIFTPLLLDELVHDVTRPCIQLIVGALRDYVAPERIFSVFALDAVADTFAATWMSETGVPPDSAPVYYHANFMYCTMSTFKEGSQKLPSDIKVELRPATISDVSGVARLCYEFAAASEPFVLTEEQALYEATLMIRSNQVWVHTAQEPEKAYEIACIVATTRTTDTVAAVTKVYTNPSWRSRGCAERLVRHVCENLLKNKYSLVLYVAHNNPAAIKVYERVGFVGYSSSANGLTDSWKEIGFDREVTELGHW
ncbi:acyl-CoA N-acyltransferase [Trametes meyenii]|nr:acyl-CoA N-acyltransferase [Trametes meyenii]